MESSSCPCHTLSSSGVGGSIARKIKDESVREDNDYDLVEDVNIVEQLRAYLV
jgi:hypothetical protein